MKKSKIQKDQGLRQAVQHKNEAAERMTLSDDFTDRLMQRIEESHPQPIPQRERRIKSLLYWGKMVGAAVAVSILLLFSVGIALNFRQSEKPDFVVQTDTIKAAPQTEPEKVEKQQKQENLEKTDTVKKIKERYRMPRPPKHYMAKAETEPITPEPEPIDEKELAERAAEEEMKHLEMEMMARMNGNLQVDYMDMTREIRERGERMSQRAAIAMSNEE